MRFQSFLSNIENILIIVLTSPQIHIIVYTINKIVSVEENSNSRKRIREPVVGENRCLIML
ncbi:MAG: hypothetical protein H6Q58_1901 [Firmicutes bacterium]|nr:hypothetical protein [Bacillota bacterium]